MVERQHGGVNTDTVVLTHDQPQSNGNASATGVPHLALRMNNGIDGGTRSGTGSILSKAPSF